VQEKAYRFKNHTVGFKNESECVSQKCISFETLVPKAMQKNETVDFLWAIFII